MNRSAGLCLTAAFALTGCQSAGGDLDYATLTPGPFRAVYLIPDANTRFDRLELIVNAGEIDNTGPEGLAHYVEHLAWLPQIGTSGRKTSRHSNAWTTNQATGYFITGPAKDLATNMERLVSVSAPLALPEKFMEEERDIVQREYDFRVKENPYHHAYQTIAKSLYDDGPLASSPIGTPESIGAFSVDLARRFHKATHQLSNMVLIADGGLTAAALQAEIDVLAPSEPSDLKPLPLPPEAPLRDELLKIVPQLSTNELLYAKSVTLPGSVPDARLIVAVNILENMLDSALPGGIAGPLRFDAFIAQSFEFDLYLHSNSHLEMRFNARPDTGVSVAQLQQSFESVLQENANVGLPQSSVEKIIKRYRDDLDAIEDIPAFTRAVLRTQIVNRRAPLGYSDIVEASKSITHSEVNQLFNALIGNGRVIAMHLSPGKGK